MAERLREKNPKPYKPYSRPARGLWSPAAWRSSATRGCLGDLCPWPEVA